MRCSLSLLAASLNKQYMYKEINRCSEIAREVIGGVGGERVLEMSPITKSVGQPFKAQWLLYAPPGLTIGNSSFCPQRAVIT